jgi:LPS-assembly protein
MKTKFADKHFLLFLLGFLASALISPLPVSAETTITADSLENRQAENSYIAVGNVIITSGSAIYKADKAIYNEKTEEMHLEGHVVLEDKDFIIKTEKADFNARTKKGMLYNAVVFLKQGKNWVHGINMQKLGDDHYYAKTVYFTACDTESYRKASNIKTKKKAADDKPDWCFRGEDANIIVGDKFTAKNATFRIKDLPVLYSPYFQGPAEKDRKTGLLLPLVGTSTSKGLFAKPSFFWAIDENRDATLSADYYSKRGVGTGLEYRFVENNHVGTWNAYQINDKKLDERFVVVKVNDRYTTPELQAFLDVHYTNKWNYYNEYGDTQRDTVSRFLQSSAEVSVPVGIGSSSRAYLLSQYWVNLRGDITEQIPQRLPEVGYVLNPTAIGPGILSVSANVANFVRKDDIHGQRLDLMPAVSYSMGDTVRLTQTATFRETAYNLFNEGSTGQNPHREMFQYRAQLQTRIIKNYGSFLHVVEPSVEYNYIPYAKVLPLFDSTELPVKESVVQPGILNRFIFKGLSASIKLVQPYDTFAATDNAVLPTVLQGFVSGPAFPVNLRFLAAYDSRNRRMDTVNSNVSFKIFKDVTLGFGELYSHVDGMMVLNQNINAQLARHWMLLESTSFDIRQPHKLRDISVALAYLEQCWNVKVIFTRRPPDSIRAADYAFVVLVELRGFGAIKL